MIMVLERECLDLSEAIEPLSEKQRIVGHCDGGQDETAKSWPKRIPEADFPGVERVGGAEDKRSIEAIGT